MHAARTYQQVAQVVDYFIEHQSNQPGLAELARQVGLSETHLQKLFSQWVGVSPKQFLKFLTKQQAKKRLRQSSVLQAALDSGLSGSGRLHDLMVSCEGVTPGQYKQWGAGLLIEYGFSITPFGNAFIAFTERGVCKLAFFDSEDKSLLLQQLQQDWPRARIQPNPDQAQALLVNIFSQADSSQDLTQPLHLLMKGSPFQLQVWQALLEIPAGDIWSYQQVAQHCGKPTGVRAVASAIARNNIGYLIPCHRVIRANGEFSHYRWGTQRKPIMLAWEACHNVN